MKTKKYFQRSTKGFLKNKKYEWKKLKWKMIFLADLWKFWNKKKRICSWNAGQNVFWKTKQKMNEKKIGNEKENF